MKKIFAKIALVLTMFAVITTMFAGSASATTTNWDWHIQTSSYDLHNSTNWNLYDPTSTFFAGTCDLYEGASNQWSDGSWHTPAAWMCVTLSASNADSGTPDVNEHSRTNILSTVYAGCTDDVVSAFPSGTGSLYDLLGGTSDCSSIKVSLSGVYDGSGLQPWQYLGCGTYYGFSSACPTGSPSYYGTYILLGARYLTYPSICSSLDAAVAYATSLNAYIAPNPSHMSGGWLPTGLPYAIGELGTHTWYIYDNLEHSVC